jgi:hypothetical protein
MSRRYSDSLFTVSFSTRGALMPAWMAQHVAASAGVDGVDVDATSPLATWFASRGGPSDSPLLPTRTVWCSFDGIRNPRLRGIVDAANTAQPNDPPLLVLLLPGATTVRELAKSHGLLRAHAPTPRFAVGLPSSSLKGGRPHLVQLGAIRRFAEEWELDVALDLSGRFDPTWEAEAAVARLGDRLRAIRLPVSAPARSAVGRDRVACRALHAALDRERQLEIAVSSSGPVPFPTTPRAAAAGAARAMEYISERVAIHAQALREGFSRFEGSPSPRGN